MMSTFTKITYTLLCILLGGFTFLNAQTDTFFVETMGPGSGTRNVSAQTFDNQSTGATYATNNTLNNLRSTVPSGVYSYASGGFNLFFPVRSTSGANGTITFTIDNIDISAFENVQLLFGIRKSNDAATPAFMTITATVDNGTPVNMVYTYAASGNNNIWIPVLSSTTIPNGSVLKLEFTRTASANTASEYRIDDISLIGTPLPLPLDLLSFEAKHSTLIWETAKEINVSHFEIESSNDTKDFSYFSSVQALNNLWITKYVSEIPLSNETKYYRLKMIDVDGTFKYSKIVMVKGTAVSLNSIHVYPNPNTTGHFSIENNTVVKEVNIYNTAGKLIVQFFNTNTFYFNPPHKGLYFVEIRDVNNQTYFQKIALN